MKAKAHPDYETVGAHSAPYETSFAKFESRNDVEPPINSRLEITREDLDKLFEMKYGDPKQTGWSPRRRLAFNYYHPAEYYEALISKLVSKDVDWLDVGSGRSPFPSNDPLAKALCQAVHRLVGIDPTENIYTNPYVHERVQCPFEDYQSEARFDLATFRMVAEHIGDPSKVIRALQRVLRPGGLVVIFTPHLWSATTMLSRLLPFKLHAPIAGVFWGSDDEDVFPTFYRMNMRKQLRKLFGGFGFRELYFAYLDDLSVFSRFKWLGYIELSVWSALHRMHARYPETCLLAAYQYKT
jgi:SAM-dependent methyltransferase